MKLLKKADLNHINTRTELQILNNYLATTLLRCLEEDSHSTNVILGEIFEEGE